MSEIQSLSLEVDDTLLATLEFEIVFSDEEQRQANTYDIVAGLVEVDDELDQYQLDESTLLGPRGQVLWRSKVLDQTPEGDRDEIMGIIGSTTRDADIGHDVITFTEDLGSVQRHIDGKHLYGSIGHDVDEGVIDYDESNDETQYHTANAELRAIVWVAPQDVVKTAFSSTSEEVEFIYVGT